MPQYFVRQPNGLLARFSTVVDNFCEVDMTEDEAVAWCVRNEFPERGAKIWVAKAVADEPLNGEPRTCDDKLHRWFSCLETIMMCRGTAALAEFLVECPTAYAKPNRSSHPKSKRI